jgi:hypothetical protein
MLIFRPIPTLFLALSSLTMAGLQAGEIDLSTGPVTAFQSVDFVEASKTVSEQLLVTSTASISLTYSFPATGPQSNDCVYGNNGAICTGTVNDFTFIAGSPSYSLNYSGTYELTPGGKLSDTGPLCGSMSADHCNFVLQPGVYTFTTSVFDQLDQQFGATALPFTDGFTGMLTFSSGNIVILTPEPSTAALLIFPVALGLLLRRRSRVAGTR